MQFSRPDFLFYLITWISQQITGRFPVFPHLHQNIQSELQHTLLKAGQEREASLSFPVWKYCVHVKLSSKQQFLYKNLTLKCNLQIHGTMSDGRHQINEVPYASQDNRYYQSSLILSMMTSKNNTGLGAQFINLSSN